MGRELAVLYSRNEALQRDLEASTSRNLELEQIHLPSPMVSRPHSLLTGNRGGPGEAETLRTKVRELEQQMQELIEEVRKGSRAGERGRWGCNLALEGC